MIELTQNFGDSMKFMGTWIVHETTGNQGKQRLNALTALRTNLSIVLWPT